VRTPTARHQREQLVPYEGDIANAEDISERVNPGGEPSRKRRALAAMINA
jgi:hypothetical protein